MPDIGSPNPSIRFIDENGLITPVVRDWFQDVTNNDLIIGTGSPEGVVAAFQGRSYMDDAGIAGAISYIKRDADDGLGDTSNGWILV